MWSDIIYVSLLLFCVFIGFYYRKIEDPHVRKWIGTIIGILVMAICSGNYILYPFMLTLINAIIITKLSPKYDILLNFLCICLLIKSVLFYFIRYHNDLHVTKLYMFKTIMIDNLSHLILLLHYSILLLHILLHFIR